jgi:hypothetical protein
LSVIREHGFTSQGETTLSTFNPREFPPDTAEPRSSNKMPAAVKGAIRSALLKHGGKTDDESREFVKTMEKEGKFFEECWS